MYHMVEVKRLVPNGYLALPTPKDWRSSRNGGRLKLTSDNELSIDECMNMVVEHLAIAINTHIISLPSKTPITKVFLFYLGDPEISKYPGGIWGVTFIMNLLLLLTPCDACNHHRTEPA